MRHLPLTALLALAASMTLGCATLISGTSQAISIDSNVPGASVVIEGNLVGHTPFSGKIKRQREAVALVSHKGYGAQPLTLTTSFNPVAILSIVWDYSTTDCLTGACWEYAPNSYYVDLAPEGTADADFRREASLMAFAMTYFGDLQTELAAGVGPKLRAMHNEFFADHSLDHFVTAMQDIPQSGAIVFGESTASLVVL